MASMDQQPPAAEESNWAELPRDLLLAIFHKLGAIEILLAAQKVCRSWRQLSHDPQIWRCINMTRPWDIYYRGYDMEKMAREAVDRSLGKLEEFSVELFGSDSLLRYIAERTSLLIHLRLKSCYRVMLIGMQNRFPLLEELDIFNCIFSIDALERVGRSCSQLKCFRLNTSDNTFSHIEYDGEAFAIANSMPKLRQLQLFGNRLTNDGLIVILDRCPHLESLDLRRCFNVKVEGSLQSRCAAIRDLRLPYDSTHDCGFICEIDDELYGNCYKYKASKNHLVYDDMFYDYSVGNDDTDEYSDFVF